MPLPEHLRREYLQALGIDSYLPRVQLPGAPPSVLAAAIPAEPEPVPETDAPAPVAKAAGKGPAVAAPAPAPGRKPAPGPADKAPDGIKPAHVAREEHRFQFLCIRASDDVAVINAMPHLGPGQLSGRHKTLLGNLLRAGGIVGTDMVVEEKPFSWPVVTGVHVDNSRRAAASALSAYLEQKRADWGFRHLLVMGEAVVNRIFSDEDSGESTVLPLAEKDWQTRFTRSLDELLQHPELKREAWSVIREKFS